MTRKIEKEEARKLRLEGKSLPEISKLLGISKGSISVWIRDLPQPEKFTLEFREKNREEKKKVDKVIKAVKLVVFKEKLDNRVFIKQDPYKGWRMYSPSLRKKENRYYVTLKKENNWKVMTLSRFKMELKLGRELSQDEHVDHIDDNKRNDDITNLQVLSPIDNIRKAHRSGKINYSGPKAEDNGSAKFSNIEIENMRIEFLAESYSIRAFARRYNVSNTCMLGILSGKSYKSIPLPNGLTELMGIKSTAHNKYDETVLSKIKQYLVESYSTYKISKILNIPKCTLYYLVKKHNLIPSSSQV